MAYGKGTKVPKIEHPSGSKSSSGPDKLDKKRGTGKTSHR